MKTIKIVNKATDSVAKTSEINSLVFGAAEVKFALRLSAVSQINSRYTSILRCNGKEYFYGICFYNNKLVRILDIYSLLEYEMNDEPNNIIEIFADNFSVGILTNTDFSIQKIQVPFDYHETVKYKFIEKIAMLNENKVFLINETMLFNEIRKLLN